MGADVIDGEAAGGEAIADEAGAGFIGVAGRIDGRKADEIAGERDEVVASGLDPVEQPFQPHSTPLPPHDARSTISARSKAARKSSTDGEWREPPSFAIVESASRREQNVRRTPRSGSAPPGD